MLTFIEALYMCIPFASVLEKNVTQIEFKIIGSADKLFVRQFQ